MKFAMKFAFTILIGVVLYGCKTTVYERTSKDGTVIRVADKRLLMMSQGEVTFTSDTNGVVSVTVKASSQTSADAFKAIAEGVASGVTRARPGP